MSDKESGETKPEMIEAVFRNGTVTVIGVVAAFSLGFLTEWGSNPVPWGLKDLFALIPIVIGVMFQMWALAAMLQPRSLELPYYNRAVRHFLIGLVIVGLGVAAALVVDVVAVSQGRDVVEAPE